MKVAVLGIGNEMKADDGIGLLAAEEFETKIRKNHQTLLINTNVPENFIGKIEKFGPEMLIIFDAMSASGNPGDIKIIEKEEIAEFSASTHNTPLGIFFQALRADAKIFLIGIQIKTTEFGEEITKEVISSLPQALSLGEKIIREASI